MSKVGLYPVEKLPYLATYFCYQHGYDQQVVTKNSITITYGACKAPLYKTSKGNCWDFHIKKDLLKKQNIIKNKK